MITEALQRIFHPKVTAKMLRKKQVLEAYKNVFSTPDGMIVFEDLCQRTGISRAIVTRDDRSLNQLEGARALVHAIARQLGWEAKYMVNEIYKRIQLQEEEKKDAEQSVADGEKEPEIIVPDFNPHE